VNSVGIGLREKIKSLRHALVVLGLKQLKRWILLALFAYNDVRGVKSPLLEMAAMRGRLMEQLARKQSEPDGDRDYADRAFMTGLLSLVDVLFEVTMEEMVNQLNLSDDIRQALLTREGPLGNLLLVAEKLEEADFHAVGELLGQSELNLDHLFYAQLEAINWVNGMGESV
jgi:EAL and modified HD-GYP domain-containing signal transduction protein